MTDAGELRKGQAHIKHQGQVQVHFREGKQMGPPAPEGQVSQLLPHPPTQASLSRIKASLVSFIFFSKDCFWCGPCLKSLLNLIYIAFVLHFGFSATRHVGS